MNKLFALLLLSVTFVPVLAQVQNTQPPAQQPSPQQPTSEEQEKEKAERQKNAFRLLDQIIDETQSLRLPENRVRVQTTAADLLWDSNQGRARALFSTAAESVAELGRQQQNNNNRRGGGPQNAERRAFQLRQELVLAAARHDAQLAYQLLAITKPAALPAPQVADSRITRPQFTPEDNLEQQLLGRIAALDPKFAAQNAEQMMEKGQFPRTMTEVINNLYKQDPDAAAKMADKTVKKLQATNLLTNVEAATLAQMLLMRGPRPAGTLNVSNPTLIPVLEQGPYAELLGNVVDMALKAAPINQNNQRGQIQRARPVAATVAGPGYVPPPGATDAQLEQQGALRLLAGLQIALPLIDQYVPAKAAAVRQKLTESGMGANSPFAMAQTMSVMQGNPSSDALVQAASTAPQQAQTRLYQQAAFKAIEEGNIDRARQIATTYLQANARDSVMQRIDFRELALKGENARLEEIRQTIARLQSEGEKLGMLLELARDTQQTNPKLSGQLLDEARQMTNHRATSYEQFEWQLRVARAFSTVDPARSFEVLDPGISQLNELVAAAAILNGFEINLFRDGELSLQGGGGLTAMVQRYGQELGSLADKDLDRAETLAGRFQYAEARIMARLAIVQGLLGISRPTSGPANVFRN